MLKQDGGRRRIQLTSKGKTRIFMDTSSITHCATSILMVYGFPKLLVHWWVWELAALARLSTIPMRAFKPYLQSAAVGGAAGLVSTLPVPGLSLASSASLLGGIAGAAGNLATQLLLPPSSCSNRIDVTSMTIAGVTGAIGGLGGATLAGITSKHGMPVLTDMGQQAISAARGGAMGGLLDMIFQYQHRLQTGISVTP